MSGRCTGTVHRILNEELLAIASSVAVAAVHGVVVVIEVSAVEMVEVLLTAQGLMILVRWNV